MAESDEPACWAWPVPPLRSLADLHQLSQVRWDRLSMSGLSWHLDPGIYRFREFHGARCAVCGKCVGGFPWWSRNTRGHVEDHCHATGQVRGLLCRGCNVQEGRAKAVRFERYRVTHPAVLLDHCQMSNSSGWTKGWPPGPPHRFSETRPFTPWR